MFHNMVLILERKISIGDWSLHSMLGAKRTEFNGYPDQQYGLQVVHLSDKGDLVSWVGSFLSWRAFESTSCWDLPQCV
jgi:hypothetical protein